jgi:hypothetical protein
MTLIIQKPTGAKLVMAQTYGGLDDPDAAVYIAAVEAADEAASPGVGALETATKVAIHSFVKGCKNDGIWPAIKASCILAGARTLAGALVPLVGAAPTNVGGLFVSDDYNRKTGLVGDGSTKYLNSNRNNNADPQNSNHNAVYASTVESANGAFTGAIGNTGAGTNLLAGGTSQVLFTRCRSSTGTSQVSLPVPGFIGMARSLNASYLVRNNGSNNTVSVASGGLESQNVLIYRRADNASPLYAAHRLAFYSIGESLDLALLDGRVTTLINAFAAAIP